MFCSSKKECSDESLQTNKKLWDEFKEKSFIKISGYWDEVPNTFKSTCKYGLDVGFTHKEKINDPNSPYIIKGVATVGINNLNNVMYLDTNVWRYINSFNCINQNNQNCSLFLYANEIFKRYAVLSRLQRDNYLSYKINQYDSDPLLQEKYLDYFKFNLSYEKITFKKIN